MGASVWIKPRGTNSVNPPVDFWISRINAKCLTRSIADSTCPYIIVAVVGIPKSWAFVMTSIHWSLVIRPGEIRFRIVSSRISAEVPGRLPTPASFSSISCSRMVDRERTDPYNTSSGEKPCICKSGKDFLISRVISPYRDPFIFGGKPAWIHTSVAPKDTASLARLTISSTGNQ